jgi:hypothetical protein
MWMIFSALRLGICINIIIGIAACSPRMDWRELVNHQEGYAVFFPGKPVVVTRTLQLGGQTVSLTLQSAKVDDAYFAVGVIPLHVEQLSKVNAIADALEDSLKNNIAGIITQHSSSNISNSNFSPWREFNAKGTLPNGVPAIVSVKFFIRQGKLIEFLTMGDANEFTPEVLEQWQRGFRFLNTSH